ncbi:MAG: S-methyl-5-thioribose-1-phosphate isomerase [Desulfobulbus sp.]|jgi:methylthioribose-1-phosphate isomerase|nr:S-methyl-5-thioribose-1-phosphate isomerase [Desulfobulbus sp.]
MRVGTQAYQSIWLATDGWAVEIIDQTRLPFHFEVVRLESAGAAVDAISRMLVRGAPLIGATAAYGFCLGLRQSVLNQHLEQLAQELVSCRPTAVNLGWAVERMLRRLRPLPPKERLKAAYDEAGLICEEDVAVNEAIGCHGLELIEAIWQQKNGQEPVRILTHCNAGWLATVDWGTALAPVYKAAAAGIGVHVWVDETRPRNQGASLTAWELAEAGIPHHLLVDNAGGHLMQRGQVDLCLVGTDRTTAGGDVCNKIGTYLKALAAADNNVPFYVALPGSTIDWQLEDGLTSIPIEERPADEVLSLHGQDQEGQMRTVFIAPAATPAINPAFDVTPARLVTGLITERGVCSASREGLLRLYPEQRR